MRSEYEKLITPGAMGQNPLRSTVVGVGQPSFLFGESAAAVSMNNDEEVGQTMRVDASIQEFKYGASTAVGAASGLSLMHQHAKKLSHYQDDDLVDNQKLFRKYNPEQNIRQNETMTESLRINTVNINESHLSSKQEFVNVYLQKLRMARVIGFEGIKVLNRQLNTQRRKIMLNRYTELKLIELFPD